jgi:hypothetical protein
MATKRAGKPRRKAKDLPVKRLSPKQTEGVRGGKRDVRNVLFVVPPKELPAK